MTHAIEQQQHTQATDTYKGVEITHGWISSNYSGTSRFYATLPNGAKVSSPVRAYLKKRINKYLKEGI